MKFRIGTNVQRCTEATMVISKNSRVSGFQWLRILTKQNWKILKIEPGNQLKIPDWHEYYFLYPKGYNNFSSKCSITISYNWLCLLIFKTIYKLWIVVSTGRQFLSPYYISHYYNQNQAPYQDYSAVCYTLKSLQETLYYWITLRNFTMCCHNFSVASNTSKMYSTTRN